MLGIEIDKYDSWLGAHLLTYAVAGLGRRRNPVHFALPRTAGSSMLRIVFQCRGKRV
jgi:hypothetical protein